MIPNTKHQPAKVLAATGAVCLTGHRCCREGSCSAVGLGREQQFGKFNWSHFHFPLSFHTCCQPYLLLVQKHLFLCSGSRNGSPIRKIEHSTGPFSLLLSTTFTLGKVSQKKVAVILDFVQIPSPPLTPIWTTCTTFLVRQRRQFK